MTELLLEKWLKVAASTRLWCQPTNSKDNSTLQNHTAKQAFLDTDKWVLFWYWSLFRVKTIKFPPTIWKERGFSKCILSSPWNCSCRCTSSYLSAGTAAWARQSGQLLGISQTISHWGWGSGTEIQDLGLRLGGHSLVRARPWARQAPLHSAQTFPELQSTKGRTVCSEDNHHPAYAAVTIVTGMHQSFARSMSMDKGVIKYLQWQLMTITPQSCLMGLKVLETGKSRLTLFSTQLCCEGHKASKLGYTHLEACTVGSFLQNSWLLEKAWYRKRRRQIGGPAARGKNLRGMVRGNEDCLAHDPRYSLREQGGWARPWKKAYSHWCDIDQGLLACVGRGGLGDDWAGFDEPAVPKHSSDAIDWGQQSDLNPLRPHKACYVWCLFLLICCMAELDSNWSQLWNAAMKCFASKYCIAIERLPGPLAVAELLVVPAGTKVKYI